MIGKRSPSFVRPMLEARRRWSGFTLVELLVVIAVIAILAGLLLPGLSHAKASAKSSKCKSNLRQLGVALRLYIDEHGKYPRSGRTTLASTWFGQLIPYAVGRAPSGAGTLGYADVFPEVFLCTEGRLGPWYEFVGSADGQAILFITNQWSHASYGYNAMGTGAAEDLYAMLQGLLPQKQRLGLGVDCAEAAVTNPSDMIALGCQRGVSGWERVISPSPSFFFFSEVGDWHRHSANILFCDAHVEQVKKTNLVAATEQARRRWNRDHEAHPETWPRASRP